MDSKDKIEGIYVHDGNLAWNRSLVDRLRRKREEDQSGSSESYLCIPWISKRPLSSHIISLLRKKLDESQCFFLYYLYGKGSPARFKATIRDFVTSEQEYEKKAFKWKEYDPIEFRDNYADYKAGKKSKKPRIVFLASNMETENSDIRQDSFELYDGFTEGGWSQRGGNFFPYTKRYNENDLKNRAMINDEYISLLIENKNLIFTGAPGTGKTYLAKQIAKELINPNGDVDLEHCEQYGFVQFHPSYDYTDFVEGLRPTTDDNGNIRFDLRPGVFKEFCEKAKKDYEECNGTFEQQIKEKYNKLIKRIKNGEKISLQYKTNQGTTEIDKVHAGCILFKENKLRKLTLQNLIEVGKNYRNKKDLQTCTVKDIDKICGQTGIAPRYWAVLNYLYTEYGDLAEYKNYVFVIDEINRGEISKIFGELFFSIDPGYRGTKGAVETQYANMHDEDEGPFYVPENVYIIGTMNDIDRSVESFDFAMRRRFTWEEITAKQSGENMGLSQPTKDRMEALNKVIAETDGLGKSYQIGGAYFLDGDGNERKDGADGQHPDYQKVWDLRLEPLLKEYLRGMPNSETKLEEFKTAFEL